MKNLFSKSRKLVLLVHFRICFVVMGAVFCMAHGAVPVGPLSKVKTMLDISARDRNDSNPMLNYENQLNPVMGNEYNYGVSEHERKHPEILTAPKNSLVVMQSEAGPVQARYNAAFKRYFNLDEKSSEWTYHKDTTSYTATTPRIIESDARDSGGYDDYQYYDDKESNRNEDASDSTESFVTNIKNIWDIFSALNTAWNTVAEKDSQEPNYVYEKKEDERLRRNSNNISNVTHSPAYYTLEAHEQLTTSHPVRSSTETAIAQGRYIKGDPLKGYYDFVITEGSYKFWAAFQLATAVLIIYSTFAAIYYSKVNPLVGDYDYVDYLGGARSMPDDSDFSDDTENDNSQWSENPSPTAPGWISTLHNDWIPKFGHTVQFILEAIDKIPQQG